MQCTSPIYLASRNIFVPCTKCISCRISYTREWSVRLMNEYETSNGKACFITLTYSNENLPSDLSLHKDELQRFFKRLRKKLGEHKIKYYACGEYGDKNHRPHYHAIIFNLSIMDAFLLLPDIWTKGFFDIQPVFYESCKYVTGYVMKKYNGQKAKEVYGEKQIPFRLSSLGLGKQYAIEYKENIMKNNGVYINGKNCGLPKYYKNKYLEEIYKNELPDFQEFIKDEADLNHYKDVIKNMSFYKQIIDKAKENQENEKQAYKKFIDNYNPDKIVNNSQYLSFQYWQRSVNKLRDLTIKAKCSLKQRRL